MMSPITTLIFDVGGVLLRTEDRRPRTKLADSLRISPGALEEIVFGGESGHAAQRGEITAAAHWENVRLKLGLREDEIGPFRDAFFGGDVLDRDLVGRIAALKSSHKTAIITNAFDDARAFLAERFHLDEVFDPIVVSAEEGCMKPDARLYEIALERCGALPEECVFVDDFRHNIEAARALGMHAIWFQEREQAFAALNALLE